MDFDIKKYMETIVKQNQLIIEQNRYLIAKVYSIYFGNNTNIFDSRKLDELQTKADLLLEYVDANVLGKSNDEQSLQLK